MAASDVTASPKVAQWAAVGALGVYAVALIWLAFGLNTSEPGWTRAIFILNGAEAIAFAAAGWLWGTQVARGALKATEDHVETVKNDLEQKDATVENVRAELEKLLGQLGRASAAIVSAHVAAGAGTQPEADADGGQVAGVTAEEPAPAAATARPDIRRMLEKAFPEAFQPR